MTQHGACLGLGLAGLGSNDEEALEEVKGVLYTDSAVAGEAAGIALGLIAVGSGSERAQELLTYAHDTQHEKARPAPDPLQSVKVKSRKQKRKKKKREKREEKTSPCKCYSPLHTCKKKPGAHMFAASWPAGAPTHTSGCTFQPSKG